MNPVVVIPTYFSVSCLKHEQDSILANYDHTTAISQPGELDRCLDSLEIVQGLGLVVVLVAAEPDAEAAARKKVQSTLARHPSINAMAVGSAEVALIRQYLDERDLGTFNDEIELFGYGSIRNVGFMIADILGFDAVVFIDDDEVIDDPDFLKKAMYGLGKLTKNGIPILAKTGYYLNERGLYLSKWEDKWYDRFWRQGSAFNAWISKAMVGPRLSRSNHVCGGCLAVHKEAFKRLAFDPWITRGEDLDYLLNLRMYGSDIWFDNKWVLRHLPPETQNEGDRFRQDIFRWLYEYRKLEYSRALIDLQQIKPASLKPYPGPFLEPGLMRRIRLTAFLRSIGRSDNKAYRRAARAATGEASEYAEANCSNYFEFQHLWPEIMASLDSNTALTTALVRSSLLDTEEAIEQAANSRVSKGEQVKEQRQIDSGLTGEVQLNIAE